MKYSGQLVSILPLFMLFLSSPLNPDVDLNNTAMSTKQFTIQKMTNINPNLNDSEEQKKGENPSRRDIYQAMLEIGNKYSIPPEILYAIAYTESEFKQFNSNGNPFVSFDNGIGMMQVTPSEDQIPFNISRAKYDYRYNIEVAAKILKMKWNDQERIITNKDGKVGNFLPIVGNRDPMVLENWYFAIWAYNGYAGENNPNCLPMYIDNLSGVKKVAYQDKVINMAEKHLRIKITKINPELLPASRIPEVGSYYETPQPMHYSILSKENTNLAANKNQLDLAILKSSKLLNNINNN